MGRSKSGVEVQGYFGKEIHYLFEMPKHPKNVYDKYNRPWVYLGKIDEEFGGLLESEQLDTPLYDTISFQTFQN